MEEDDSDREVAIPILTRKPSTGALKPISLDDTEEGASKSASSDQDTEIDKKYELEKNRDDDLELRRDLMHVAIILIISGAVVALNLLGMLFAIPGLKSHLTRKIFTLEEIQKLAKTISNYAHQHIVRTLTVQILLGTW
eukprot:CAMPEP_0185274948 /NCGR_PEP_ID=MMETSP1359-20130426/52958_1 /TAXON_ID=552665 /ORGANISM="Bigelowiella longifila, Strain CCMP242" /LENGTH=138 /DNA_ID=CAMNT_0027868107 /DNA_START=101 /DNA_END=514 /DNA_ORIENTATION=-